MTKRKLLLAIAALSLTALVVVCSFVLAAQSMKSASQPGKQAAREAAGEDYRPDIVIAVKAAAAKDCGCGECAAKGCNPCHGTNCYFCVAKALMANECGCKGCGAKGCKICGPGCDVCKFHLAPNAEAKAQDHEHKK